MKKKCECKSQKTARKERIRKRGDQDRKTEKGMRNERQKERKKERKKEEKDERKMERKNERRKERKEK